MQPVFKTLPEKKLIGMHVNMSIANNKTFELWSALMPRRKEITNNLNSDLFSIQIFNPQFNFQQFDINAPFEKWAAIEVLDFDNIPDCMHALTIPSGLYAVFLHKGPASQGARTFSYIFGTWLPSSGYAIDNRPHFEILGEKYKHDQPDSEEEVWIPVKVK